MKIVNYPTPLNAFIAIVRIFLETSPPDEWPAGCDAGRLASWARALGLAPILYLNPARRLLGSESQQEFKRAYLLATAHNVKLSKTLAELCEVFEERGIEIVSFKGVTLSKQLYGDSVYRQSVDLDLMVKRADVRRALSLLGERGFELSLPESDLTTLLFRAYSLELRNPQSGVMVDLQWDVANGYCPSPFREAELFRATRAMLIENRPVPAFAESVTLYLLCVHGAKNSWCELRSLLDLAMVMKHGSPALWQEVTALMRQQGTLTMLLTGVLLANEMLGVAVPPVVAGEIGRSAHRLAGEIHTYWQTEKDIANRPPAWKRFWWDLRFREGRRERLRYFFFRLRPTKTDLLHQRQGLFFPWMTRLLRVARGRNES